MLTKGKNSNTLSLPKHKNSVTKSQANSVVNSPMNLTNSNKMTIVDQRKIDGSFTVATNGASFKPSSDKPPVAPNSSSTSQRKSQTESRFQQNRKSGNVNTLSRR